MKTLNFKLQLLTFNFALLTCLLVSSFLGKQVRAFTTDSTSLPESLQNHASVTVDLPGPNERVYVIGGFNSQNQASNKIYSIKVNSNSTLDSQGGWRTEANLPTALAFPGVTLIDPGSNQDKILYVIGGEGGNGAGINPSNVVYKAGVDKSTGVVSSFSQLNSSVQKLDPTISLPIPGQYEPITLPKKLYGHSVISATIGGTTYIYIIGGDMSSGHTTVYRAALDSNFNLVNQNTTDPSSSFQPLTSNLPVPLQHHQASLVTKDNNGNTLSSPTILITGGLITTGVSDKIYTTKINTDGTLTAFTQETLTLPEQVFFHSQDVNPSDGTLVITGGKKQDRVTRGEAKLDKLTRLSLNSQGNVNSIDDLTGGIGEALQGHSLKITPSGKTILLGGQKEITSIVNGRTTTTNPLDSSSRTDTVTSIKTRGKIASYSLTDYRLLTTASTPTAVDGKRWIVDRLARALKKLFSGLRSIAERGVEHDDRSNNHKSAYNIEGLQRSNSDIHDLSFPAAHNPAPKETIDNTNPHTITTGLGLSIPEKIGNTNEASNSNDKLPKNSDNHLTWLSESLGIENSTKNNSTSTISNLSIGKFVNSQINDKWKMINGKLKKFLAGIKELLISPVLAAHTCVNPTPCADKTWTANDTVSAGSTNDYNAVAINTAAIVTLTNTGGTSITFSTHAWTIGNGSTTTGTLSFNGTTQVTINTNGNTITVSGTGGIGNITHTANTSALSYYVNLSITGNFTLNSGGTVNVNGKGYTVTNGTGRGTSRAGGAYGGNGGQGWPNAPGVGGSGYGTLTAPAELGSGAGSQDNTGSNGQGGGLIQITVSGTTTINGTISGNGNSGGSTDGGGGAGGGIYLNTGTLADSSGSITADGGNGNEYGGGGGGGRIAIIYTTNNDASTPITKTAYGGPKGTTSAVSHGGAGTVYMATAVGASRTLTVDNNTRTNPGTPVPSSTTWTVDTLQVNNAGDLYVSAGTLTFANNGSYTTSGSNTDTKVNGGTLSLPANVTISGPITHSSGSISTSSTNLIVGSSGVFSFGTTTQVTFASINVQSGGKITHTANTSSLTHYLNLSITGDLTVTGDIDVAGKGYTQNNGTGKGTVNGGGGYGGAGGRGWQGGDTGGSTYGSLTSPADVGSAGGNVTVAGAGGGLVRLTVSGTTTVNGTISANGAASSGGTDAGGGSGGGIYISTATFANSSGSITANGGAALATGTGGGGGGAGRIAIVVTGDFGGASGPTINSIGGAKGGYSGTVSGNGGTVYLEYATKSYAGTVSVAGGTGASAGTAYQVGTPASPSSLVQAATSGGTSLDAGSNITNGTTAYLRATATDADPGTNPTSETLKLQAEVRAVGTSFSNTATHTGSTVSYSGSSVTASVDSSSLSQGTSYHWQARVCDNSSGLSLGDYSGGDKCGSWVSFGGNAESAADFLVVGVPGAPTGATASVASTTSATVTWTAPVSTGGSTITSYTVTSSPGSKTATWTSGSLTATVTGLTRGTAYTFTVTATNVAGTGSASAASNSITARLNEPTSFAGTADASGKIKWTWTDNSSDETGFKLYDSSDNLKATISTASTTSYTESGLIRNTSYSRYLVAYDSIGNSTATSTVSVTTKATDPTSPDIQSPKTNEVISSTRPEVEWKKATDSDDAIDSYSVTLSYYNSGSTIFIISSIPKDGSSTSCGSLTGSVRTCSYAKYKVAFTNEDTSSTDDDRIKLTTKSSSSWIGSELDGAFPAGVKLNIKVTAHNSAGGAASSSQPFTISSEPPLIQDIRIRGTSDESQIQQQDNTYYTTSDKITLTATVSSLTTLKELIITLSKKNSTLGITTSATPIESTTLVLTDYSLRTTASGRLEADVSWTPRSTLEQDALYAIDLTLTDTGSLTSTQTVSLSRVSKARLEKLSNLQSVSLVELEKQALTRKQKEAENLTLAINNLIPTSLQEYISNSILTLNILPTKLAAAIQSTIQSTADRLQTTVAQAADAVLTPVIQAIAAVLPTPVKEALVQVATTTTNALDLTQQVTQPLNQAFANASQTRPKKAQEEIFKSVSDAAETTQDYVVIPVLVGVDAAFNKAAPTISDVTIEEVGDTYAVVSWKSNHYSTGKLNYGLEPGHWYKKEGGGEVFSSKKKKLHRVKVEGIEPNTKYYFEVMSQNGGYVYDAYYGFITSE